MIWEERVRLLDSGRGPVPPICDQLADQHLGERRERVVAAEEVAAKTPGERSLALLRLADTLEADAAWLAKLEVEGSGKPWTTAFDGELPFGIDNLRFFAGTARSLGRGQCRDREARAGDTADDAAVCGACSFGWLARGAVQCGDRRCRGGTVARDACRRGHGECDGVDGDREGGDARGRGRGQARAPGARWQGARDHVRGCGPWRDGSCCGARRDVQHGPGLHGGHPRYISSGACTTMGSRRCGRR
jgi:hypothetical protein